MSVSGKNMQRVVVARDHHNATCPLGPAVEVHMCYFDIERCGWEEGDNIGGLTLVCSDRIATGRLEVHCAGDGVGGELQEEEPVVDAVSRDRDLVLV